MKLGHVQRLLAAATTLAVFTAAPLAAQAAPSKGKKDKKEEPEPQEEAEEEPEPEPEEEPEPEPETGDAATAAAATGRGMKGRIGLGGTRSLSGVNGISLRYYPIDKLSIGALIGFATFSHKEPDDNGDYSETKTVGLLGAGAQVFYWPVQGDRNKYISADFGFGARGVVYVGFDGEDNEDDANETLDGPLEIAIEIPITTHVFIGDSVAITPEFGFVARIVPGSREPDEQDNVDTNPGTGVGERLGTTNGPGLGFELGEHGGVFFGLSITYFFGADKDKKPRKRK